MESFIGIDMAWRIDGNHSGIAVMRGGVKRVRLDAVSTDVTSMFGVMEYVSTHAAANTVIAIDASLIVRNATGQRPCETMIAKEFGKYHASCHTTNLGRLLAETGMDLVEELSKSGFKHEFQINKPRQQPGRWVFEVYPHPAMVRLFDLDRIIKYKKGSDFQKRAGLAEYRGLLLTLASGVEGLARSPVLDELLEQDLIELRGEALKRYEDTLDAIFCAYLAWYCCRWGAERNQQFGTLAEGYIVVPKRSTDFAAG